MERRINGTSLVLLKLKTGEKERKRGEFKVTIIPT